jgi:hypothetical protein
VKSNTYNNEGINTYNNEGINTYNNEGHMYPSYVPLVYVPPKAPQRALGWDVYSLEREAKND